MSQYPPPPPPPGGYGTPPPGGYDYGGQPPIGPAPWDIGAALSYGWAKFQSNVGQILLAALALIVAMGVVYALMFVIVLSAADSFLTALVAFGITFGIILIAGQVVGAGLIRASLDVTDGRPFQTSRVFVLDNIGNVVLTSLLVGAISGVGFALCYLPGLVATFLLSYSLYFVVDQGLSPVDAVKASYDLTTQNLGTTVVWYVVGGLVAAAGALACGVGVLVTVPLVLIGTAYTYKSLTHQPIAA